MSAEQGRAGVSPFDIEFWKVFSDHHRDYLTLDSGIVCSCGQTVSDLEAHQVEELEKRQCVSTHPEDPEIQCQLGKGHTWKHLALDYWWFDEMSEGQPIMGTPPTEGAS